MGQENVVTKPIKKKVAQKMVKVYSDQQRKVKVPGGEKFDTKSVWISKKVLLDYLIFDNPMSTGVRIYFGVTGKYKDVNYDCKDGYENQTNLILVATTSPNNELPTMANSSNIILNNLINSLDAEEENKAFLITSGEGMALDDHDLCPPAPDGSRNCSELV